MSEKNKQYRANFVLDLRGQSGTVESIVEHLKTELGAIQAEVTHVEDHGSKEFVRVTDKSYTAGNYVSIDFRSPPEAPAALHERLRLNKTVNRVIVTALP